MPTKKKSAAASLTSPGEAPTRVVLWMMKGGANKVWRAERTGSTWRASWGKRSSEKRSEKVSTLATAEKATAAFLKAVAAKRKEGYLAAPDSKEARELVWRMIGLECDGPPGELCVTKVAPHAAHIKVVDDEWFQPGDFVTDVRASGLGGPVFVQVIEELAVALQQLEPGTGLYLGARRAIDDGCSIVTCVHVTRK